MGRTLEVLCSVVRDAEVAFGVGGVVVVDAVDVVAVEVVVVVVDVVVVVVVDVVVMVGVVAV